MKRHLPAPGYLYLATLALRQHGTLSKGRLAREIRANHTMATKTLEQLVADDLARVSTRADGAYDITALPGLLEFLDRHGASLARLYREPLLEHYRYGRPPIWATVAPWLGTSP